MADQIPTPFTMQGNIFEMPPPKPAPSGPPSSSSNSPPSVPPTTPPGSPPQHPALTSTTELELRTATLKALQNQIEAASTEPRDRELIHQLLLVSMGYVVGHLRVISEHIVSIDHQLSLMAPQSVAFYKPDGSTDGSQQSPFLSHMAPISAKIDQDLVEEMMEKIGNFLHEAGVLTETFQKKKTAKDPLNLDERQKTLAKTLLYSNLVKLYQNGCRIQDPITYYYFREARVVDSEMLKSFRHAWGLARKGFFGSRANKLLQVIGNSGGKPANYKHELACRFYGKLGAVSFDSLLHFLAGLDLKPTSVKSKLDEAAAPLGFETDDVPEEDDEPDDEIDVGGDLAGEHASDDPNVPADIRLKRARSAAARDRDPSRIRSQRSATRDDATQAVKRGRPTSVVPPEMDTVPGVNA